MDYDGSVHHLKNTNKAKSKNLSKKKNPGKEAMKSSK